MRRFLSMLLALAVGLSLVSCAAAETYNLDIYWVGNGDNPEIREPVEQAVNSYIEPLIGATVTFHIVNWDYWYSDAIGALEKGEKMDLIFTADWEGYSKEVSEGLLLPLNDLLEEEAPGILATLPLTFLNGVRVNNVVYGIPTNKELCVPMGFIVNKTAAAEIGWDVEQDDPTITCTEDLEPWLAKYKEKYPDKYPYLLEGRDGRWVDEPWIPDWVNIENNAIAMKMARQEDGSFDETIYSIFFTEEEEQHMRLMHRFYESGYISPESTDPSYNYNEVFGRGDFLVFTQPLKGFGIKAAEMIAANATADFECVEITMQPKYIVTTHAGGSMFAIPVTSQDPVKAMKYLELMHCDGTLINMMLYGVENVNYTKTEDFKLDLIPDCSWYHLHGGAWTVGNTKLQYVLTNEDVDKNSLLQRYADDAIATPSLGFRFDGSKVSEQIDNVSTAVIEYVDPLRCGLVDPDDPDRGIQAMRAALEKAGINDILAEVQAQYDAWKLTK